MESTNEDFVLDRRINNTTAQDIFSFFDPTENSEKKKIKSTKIFFLSSFFLLHPNKKARENRYYKKLNIHTQLEAPFTGTFAFFPWTRYFHHQAKGKISCCQIN
jgi:hypothetical protein